VQISSRTVESTSPLSDFHQRRKNVTDLFKFMRDPGLRYARLKLEVKRFYFDEIIRKHIVHVLMSRDSIETTRRMILIKNTPP